VSVAIAATFTAEPLLQLLELALGEAGLRPTLHLAPDHRLFQQLLSAESLLATHEGAANVLLIRLEDFVREVLEPADALSLIERTSRQLSAALLQFGRRSRSPLIVLLLPVSAMRAEPLVEALQAATARLRAQLAASPAMHAIDVAQIETPGDSDPHNRLRDELAHIPYTEEYFAAIALVLARRIHAPCVNAQHGRLESTLTTAPALLEALRSRQRRTRPLRARPVQAASPTERQLLSLWQELLNIDPLGVEDNFFALGGTSLLAARLFAEIARRFGVRLRTTLVAAPTVRALARALRHEEALQLDQPLPLLIELKAGGPTNLFLVHDGDGDTLLYRDLAQRLPAALSVWGIEPRRLAHVPLAAACIEQMAGDYIVEVRRLQPTGPYRLGGLCAGAVIAYEMALQLQAAGERVALVALLDGARPGARRRSGRLARQRAQCFEQMLAALRQTEPSAVLRGLRVLRGSAGKLAGRARWTAQSRLQRLSVRLRFVLLRQRLARGHAWPDRLPALSVREIYDSAEARYAPQPLSGAGTLLLRAREGLGEPNDTPYRLLYADETLGWSALVPDLEVIDAEGGHTSMLQEPQVICLARALAERVQARTGSDRTPVIAGSNG
jgi:thioesterase domain-containing protein